MEIEEVISHLEAIKSFDIEMPNDLQKEAIDIAIEKLSKIPRQYLISKEEVDGLCNTGFIEKKEIKVGDKFIFHSSNGLDYKMEIININDFREPSMRYAIDIEDCNGNHPDDYYFVGIDFFTDYEDIIERIKE